MDDKNKKIAEFIKGNLVNVVVILISVAYILYGMLKFERTGLTIEEQLIKAGLGIIVGLLIKQGVGENGFNKGYNSLIWHTNIEKYNNACNLANPYLDRVDNFYFAEEMEMKKQYRRTLLMEHQMKYGWFFDNKGNYIDNKEQYAKLTRKQIKALKKAIKVKVYNLNLFSEYSIEIESAIKREKTDKQQRAKMFGKNGIAQIMTAVVGAYIIPLWTGWSWGEFIMTSLQVILWVFCGVSQLYLNYNYVVIEKVNKIKRKMELLVKFKQGCENNLYLKNPFDEEETICQLNEIQQETNKTMSQQETGIQVENTLTTQVDQTKTLKIPSQTV